MNKQHKGELQNQEYDKQELLNLILELKATLQIISNINKTFIELQTEYWEILLSTENLISEQLEQEILPIPNNKQNTL